MQEIDYSLFWKMFECIRQHEPKGYSTEKWNVLNSLSKKPEVEITTKWKVICKNIKSIRRVILNYS